MYFSNREIIFSVWLICWM